MTDLYIYSDESGVFDKVHYDTFIFGGLIFTSKKSKDDATRKFLAVERRVKSQFNIKGEMKGSKIDNKTKYNLYRSFNIGYKFCTKVEQKRVYDQIFEDKKTKQRFLDYAYKMGLKHGIMTLIDLRKIRVDEVRNIYVYCDAHTTSTNGVYELQESLETEFKYGAFSYDFTIFHEPIFPNMGKVEVRFVDSKTSPLIRASDIISNYLYNKSKDGAEIKSCFVRIIP